MTLDGRTRFLRAARGEAVDRPPLWLMRQAGRYLPEYLALRERYTFEQAVTEPEIAERITLQPIERFDFDAAILFSDILVPLAGMGRPARFPGEGGPRIDDPVRTVADVEALRVPEPGESTPYVAEAVARVRRALPGKAVLGFAGGPFTLAAYLVEGGAPEPFAFTKALAYRHPAAFTQLLSKCAQTVSRHIAAQLDAGADAIQLFDTWAEILSPREYRDLVLPHVRAALLPLRSRGKPLLYFARGTSHLLPHLGETGADVLSVDWRVSLEDVAKAHPGVPVQGNLDPTLLFAPPSRVRSETLRVLDEGRAAAGHILNLGHGILPRTPLESVEAMARAAREWTPHGRHAG